MNDHITADHLVDAASKAVTEELFRNFNNTLQSFCDEERDRVVLFARCATPESDCPFCENTCPTKKSGQIKHEAVSWI